MRDCAREIILAPNLFRQSEAQYRIPVRIPVTQGIGKARFMDNAGVQPSDRSFDRDPAVEKSMYV